jgi:hypothetical protein
MSVRCSAPIQLEPTMIASPHPTKAASPLQVLVVCPRGEYLDAVRGLAIRWKCNAQIHWTADPLDALRRAQLSPPALAILDARIDRASGCLLSRELALGSSALDVLSFDAPGVHGTHCHPSTWHWSELPRAVAWWVQRQVVTPRPVH